ncbi:hypothetical protein EKO27_g8173 [Xylaria grammica]|uniref:Uncharacterized protein n=1 Tax=Xylaria grammica TaxID=363999 RepID=A0A439CXI9_9PEZI|nr:hypothetical protein EKO27_g8173 [Xylaria grammica]
MDNKTFPWRHVEIQPDFAQYLNPWTSMEMKSTVLGERAMAVGLWRPVLGNRLITGYEAKTLVETLLNLMIVNGISRSLAYLQQIGRVIRPDGDLRPDGSLQGTKGIWWKDMLRPHWRGLDPRMGPDAPYASSDYGNSAYMIPDEEKATSSTIRMYALVNVYSYSHHDTATVLSILVLSVCLLVMSAFIGWSWYTGISSSSWTSPTKLLALGLESPQPIGDLLKTDGIGAPTKESMGQIYTLGEMNGKV